MKESIIRSPFFYVGDKFKLMSQLKENFPKNINRFIEPFCGGGSVFLNSFAQEYLVNDIDSFVIKLHEYLTECSKEPDVFWQQVTSIINNFGLSATFLDKGVPEEYKKQYPKTYFAKYNKDAYSKLRDCFNGDKSNMLILYLLLIYGFNRMLRFNSKGNFNLPVGNVDFNLNVEKALKDYFETVKNLKIVFHNMDFISFIQSCSPTENDFVYLDPPYLITFSEYNKLWTEQDEIRMLNMLDELDDKNVRFAISNVIWHKKRYNAIFNEWAQKYNIVKIKSNYISYHDNTEKDSYEVLVKNF